MNCPMCTDGLMKCNTVHNKTKYPHADKHTHIYICEECPFIGFEYYSGIDTEALITYLTPEETKETNEMVRAAQKKLEAKETS